MIDNLYVYIRAYVYMSMEQHTQNAPRGVDMVETQAIDLSDSQIAETVEQCVQREQDQGFCLLFTYRKAHTSEQYSSNFAKTIKLHVYGSSCAKEIHSLTLFF